LKYSVRVFVEYIYKMQHLEVSGAVRHIYIYVIRRLKIKDNTSRDSYLQLPCSFNVRSETAHYHHW